MNVVIKHILVKRLINLSIGIVAGLLFAFSVSYINAIRYNHPLFLTSEVIIGAIIAGLIFLESVGFISGKIDKKYSWYENINRRFWIQLFIITPYAVIFWLIELLFITFVIAGDQNVEGLEILIYFLIGIFISLLYCSIQLLYHYTKRKRFSELDKLKFEKEDVQLKFQSLKDQLSPHFLFNNLHTLHGLINEDAGLASDFVLKLSDIYRYVLETKENEIVTLKSEIEFIDKYLSLLKIRYGANFITEIKVNLDPEKYFLPPLTLQLLVENAQKHNHIDEDNPVKIDIYNENDEYLVIKNNINKPITRSITLKSGLTNLKSRYNYLIDKEIKIHSNNYEFTVEVPLIQMS